MALALHSFQVPTSQIHSNIKKEGLCNKHKPSIFFYFFLFKRPTQAIRYLLKQSTFRLCILSITSLSNITDVISPTVSTNRLYSVLVSLSINVILLLL